jgi:site-specific recombinase XerC
MPTLIDAVQMHLAPRLALSTRKQYAFAAKKLKELFSDFTPEQVTPKHIAQIKVALARTPNMANRVLSFSRQVFDYALERQLIQSNPAIGIKRHREAKRTRLITQAEFDSIYAKAGPGYR